jgi:glycosyltransferase XagB
VQLFHGAHADGRTVECSSHAAIPDASGSAPARPDVSASGDSAAFLSALGASQEDLAASLCLATSHDASLVRAYVCLGKDREERLYRRFARNLGLKYVEDVPGLIPPDPAGTGRPEDVYLIAPEPEALRDLAESHRKKPLNPAVLYMTRPATFRSILAGKSQQSARRATWELTRLDRDLSASSTRRREVATLTICLLLLGFGCFIPHALGLIGSAAFLPSILIKIYATANSRMPPSSPRLADSALPIYTVLAPLYKEANVVETLLKALLELDYPCTKLDIKILLEQDDLETRAAVAALSLPQWFEVHVVSPGEPKTKPGALNFGLPPLKWSVLKYGILP